MEGCAVTCESHGDQVTRHGRSGIVSRIYYLMVLGHDEDDAMYRVLVWHPPFPLFPRPRGAFSSRAPKNHRVFSNSSQVKLCCPRILLECEDVRPLFERCIEIYMNASHGSGGGRAGEEELRPQSVAFRSFAFTSSVMQDVWSHAGVHRPNSPWHLLLHCSALSSRLFSFTL